MADAETVVANNVVDLTMDDDEALNVRDAATDVKMTENDEPDRAFWMTSPGVVDDGHPPTEEIGDEPYKTAFAVRIVDKPASAFFQDHYKRFPQTKEVSDYHLKQAQAFNVARASTVWRSSDGEALAYFIKGGMSTGIDPGESAALLAQSEEAASALQRDYRPRCQLQDSRVAEDGKVMKGELEQKGLKYARIVSLTH